ncbi:ribonucleoside diphosphate reductase large subunit [Bacillus phage SWEP1]|nr:ribonucleoside diphosphate reductase large subunit [Bacillus phage SWEP1]
MENSIFDEAHIQSISEEMAKDIREQFEAMGNMTTEELEDFNTRMYVEQYLKFFKDIYGDNPEYTYTREGNQINLTVYPYMPLEYITVDIKI